jgi:hypothetical protein
MAGDRVRQPSDARRDVQELLRWCGKHNSGNLVQKHFSSTRCNDTAANHKRHWNTLQRIQRLHDSPHAHHYSDAFALMNQAYPGRWRASRTGGFIIGVDSYSSGDTLIFEVLHAH